MPGSDARMGGSRATNAACALLAAVLGLVLAWVLAHDDFVGDGPRFQRLLRNHLLCEHPIYLPALRCVLLVAGTPEEAMRWLSALGAACLGLGSYLGARALVAPPGALLLAASVSGSASALYHGGATELHAFHGGWTALLLARCARAEGTRISWLDGLLLFLTAGSHSSGGLAAMACVTLRAERMAGDRGLRLLGSPVAWSILARSALVAALPLLLTFAVEPRLMSDYLSFIVRQETGHAFPRQAFLPYLAWELFLPAPALAAAAGLALLVGFRQPVPGRATLALALAGFALVFGPVGIAEQGGYFLPLLPLCALVLAGLVAPWAPGKRLPVLLAVLAVQVAVGVATRAPAPPASESKRQQRALVASLPPRALLILYVPWEASRATQDYLWEVHDPTRDNTALYERDPEHILAPEFRADPPAALLARARAHRAGGLAVVLVDPAAFPQEMAAQPGIAALRALTTEFATRPAQALPGFLELQ